MFTIEQIKAAHSKVKSGADFPAYVKELIVLGVIAYDAHVSDGGVDYFGANAYKASAPAKYETLDVARQSDLPQFKADLKAHQQGQTDYSTFCKDCARSGIEKWTVSTEQMTCTYFDKMGTALLTEHIPSL